jgi:hypothetical protein
VDEYVLAAAVRRDEAKAFGCVEELYDTCVGSHGIFPCNANGFRPGNMPERREKL